MTNGGKQSKTAITPYDIRVFQDTFFRCITEKRESFYVWKNNLDVLNEYLKQGANAYHFQNILYLLFYRFINISKKEKDFKYLKGMSITFQELSKSDAIGGIFEPYRMLINKFSISQIIQSNISQENINNYKIHCGLKSVDNQLLLICAVFMLAQEKLTEKEKSIYTNLKLNLLTEILLSLHDFVSIDICTLDSYEIKDLLSLLEKSIETEDYQSDIREPLKEIKLDELKYLTNANASIENLRNAISNAGKMESISIDSNEFAQEKIGKVVREIYKWYENKDLNISPKDFHNATYIVDLIGEPLLQHKLHDMLITIQKRVLW